MKTVKNAAANEFLARADALALEIANPDVTLTGEELKQKVDGIAALRQRAHAVAELTPEKIAADDLDLKPLDLAQDDAPDEGPSFKEASEMVVKSFGSVGRYILSQAREGSKYAKPLTTAQRKAHTLLQRLIVGTGSDASGGEFLLPLTQAPDIFVGAAIVQPGLFERAPKYACPGRTVRIPYMEQTVVTDTRPLSGIAATAIEAEGGEKDEREPSIKQRVVTAYKWAAYTEAGDEILEDDYTGQLPQILQRAVGGDITNSINLSVTRGGSGSGQPLGALHASNGALITVNRNTSQSVDVDDLLRMLSKSTMGPGTFWLASPSCIPEIYALALTSGSQVTFLNNLRDGAGAQLFGLPLVFSHLSAQLGVAGDVGLIDPNQYAAVLRRQVTMESSIHYKFRNDVTAYRFFARAGGMPIPDGTYAFASSGSTKEFAFSGFVRLGDDIAS